MVIAGDGSEYHSISDFRKTTQCIASVVQTVCFLLKDEELVAGELIAIDGTKVRANNSKKANYSQKKIDRPSCIYQQQG
ncbi:hypothetical protein EMGBS15_02800 [Filimonas sp.]|nr:hypothetical protein EMGBS15_02800 [Filimonas sp.]